MKISKTVILTLSAIFLAGSMGLILVNAEEPEDELEIDIYVDPSNAVQHIQEVQFVLTGENTKTAKMVRKNNGLVGIETNADFILSKTGDDINIVLNKSSYNSILGGIKNRIGESSVYNVILAGSGNNIKGTGNTIVGGEGNSITGQYSTVLGGKTNMIEGDYSVVVGGSGNIISGNYSTVIGKNNSIKGNNSAALGKNARVEANNSFYFANPLIASIDPERVDELYKDNVFAIHTNSGAVINSNMAHNFAKLTLGGALSIFSNTDDVNIQCGSGVGGGIVKVVNTDVGQMCLCSCDGYGWNSVFAMGRCVGACHQDEGPECDDKVERVCNNAGGFTYSGGCKTGFSIDGEGSYLVDKYNRVHWSCQTEDGLIKFCSGDIAASVDECAHACEGDLPNNAKANGRQITDRAGVQYFYDPESTKDCSYSCLSGFNYVIDGNEKMCVKCKDGTYNTGSRTCTQEAICEDGKVPYSGGCIYLGECLNKPRTFKIGGIEQFNGYSNFIYGYPNFQPYGGNVAMNWTCKSNSGEVRPHSCEFSCNDGYHCNRYYNDGFWGEYCESNNLGCCGYYNKYSELDFKRMENPEFGVWRWAHPVYNSGDQQYNVGGTLEDNGGYLAVEYVDSMDDLIDKKTRRITGCYFYCDLGFHERETPQSYGSVGKCDSNCKKMHLGAVRQGEGLDMLYRNDASNITGWFHNGRFERNATKKRNPNYSGHWYRSGGTLTEWTYVDPGVLDDAVANNTGICLWTCRSGIPIPHINTVSPFKETFHYGSTAYEINTCWETCPDNYYFSGFKCQKVSSNQYIPDRSQTITYSGIINPIAQRSACNDPDDTYQNGHCVLNFTTMTCPEGHEYVNGQCISCQYGYGFTGNNYDCAAYDRCDINQNWLINEKDRDSISACITSGVCNGREDLDRSGGVNSGDLQYFDDICYMKMCDHNGDGDITSQDTELYLDNCRSPSERAPWCDLNGDGVFDNLDKVYWNISTGKCKALLP